MNLRIVRKMNPLPRNAAEWLQALAESVEDLTPESLGFTMAGVVSYRVETKPVACGVLLPVSGEADSLQIGLFASADGCRRLAAAYAGQSSPDRLTDRDVADALGELLTTLVASVKGRLGVDDDTLRSGLPIYLRGRPETGTALESSGLQMLVGPVEVQLLVLRRAE